MEERRKFKRWRFEEEKKVVISHHTVDETVSIVDISTGGMKIKSFTALQNDDVVCGEIELLPRLGPFYIRGTVRRVTEKQDFWEVAVAFNKVRGYPLSCNEWG
jgi:hypothetical protein